MKLLSNCAALALSLVVLACASPPQKPLYVSSSPPGARIVIDGLDSGQTTPAQVLLPVEERRFAIELRKSGYNSILREVRMTKDIEVMGPDEVAARVVCAPCCLGLTLPGLLTPVDVEPTLIPDQVDAVLDVEGQGLRLTLSPPGCEVEVDGSLVRPLEGVYYILSPGDHRLVVSREGYRSYERQVRVEERLYHDLEVALSVEGQGIELAVEPADAVVYADGRLQGGDAPGRVLVRSSPGVVVLRVEKDGYQPFEAEVDVVADQFRKLAVELQLEGEGVIVRRPPSGWLAARSVEILIDGALESTRFGEPIRTQPGQRRLSVLIDGCEPWERTIQVGAGHYLELEPVVKPLAERP